MTTQKTDFETEKINDDYSYVKYANDFTVIMMSSGKHKGYINATKLCNDGGRELKSWRRLDLANTTIKQCRLKTVNEDIDDVLIKPEGLGNKIKGTYVHKYLVLAIAQWISVEFVFKLTKIVDEWMEMSQGNTKRL